MVVQPRNKVHGNVTGVDGLPVPGAVVTVWWQRIRESMPVSAGKTDESGSYHLEYELPPGLAGRPSIVVEARSEKLEAALASPVTDVKTELEINLSAQPKDDSKFTRLLRCIEQIADRLPLGKMVEDGMHHDVSFVARELSLTPEQVMQVLLSIRLEEAFKAPSAAFYAFLAQRVPAALPDPLLDASQQFSLIDALVHTIGSMIFALSADLQQRTLTGAIALDLIATRYTDQIQQIVGDLQSLGATSLLEQPFLVGNASLSQLLTVAGLGDNLQQSFARALATNSKLMRSFWKNLATGKSGFTPEEASSIERTLSIGSFVKNHIPLVQLLVKAFDTGTYKNLEDLAKIPLSQWEQMITQTGAPAGIDGAGTATSAQVFASVVYARVTRAYPTAALSARVGTVGIVAEKVQGPLTQFFRNNSSLELVKQNIPAYLAVKGAEAFTGINQSDQAAVVTNLRSFQRILRVSSNVDVAQGLLVMGYTSATKIFMTGRQQFFLQAKAAGLTGPEASHVYATASQRYAGVIGKYMQLNIQAQGAMPGALGNTSAFDDVLAQAVKTDPSLATLFGSQDYCEVDDCTSILSAAAYLCDLLQWLGNRQQSGHTALDVLNGRRPDIANLLLNCPNTDTELPYIDLVIELLADKVSPPAGSGTPTNPLYKQTSADKTTAQLTAAPEYFNQDAFALLAGAAYPWSLPYSTGLDELRIYLQQLKLPLWQLRQALLPVTGAGVTQQAAVAAERLGLNGVAMNLITTPDFVPATTAWNLADFTSSPTGLGSVPIFLTASGLSFGCLLTLLKVAWVQGGLGIQLTGLNDDCDTGEMTLIPAAPLDPGFLDRAHRFVRLWKATQYQMWELDLLVTAPAVGNNLLDQAALVGLQSFWQLQQATKLPVDQLLSFYQIIDTQSHLNKDGSTTLSLYSRVFLNPTIAWIAPDTDLAALPGGGAPAEPNLNDHIRALQAALGVSSADMNTLLSLTDNQLTLDNLSLMYRVNALAVASKFSLANLFTVALLLNPGAGSQAAALAIFFAGPPATLDFLARATNIQQASLSLDAVTYLLTPPVAPPFTATTSLAVAIDDAQTTITVASDIGFPASNFYIAIGLEILLVTAVGGVGNDTWTVMRGQQGTIASSSSIGAVVTPAGNGGWSTTTQMTPDNIAAAIRGVQQAIVQLLSASTTLTAGIDNLQTSLTVTGSAGFPAPGFFVYIGSEILQVTAIGGTNNTTWTVVRGQQGTAAAIAKSGSVVTPTSGDMDGAVVAAVAAGAHSASNTALANDVAALVLGTVQTAGTAKSLLATLEDPALVAPTGTIDVGGTPAAGDQLTTVLTNVGGNAVTVSYTLVAADAGDVNQTAAHFAAAINASAAVTGTRPFLLPCVASGAMITLTASTPGAPGSNVVCTSAATGNSTLLPASTALNGVPNPTQANFPNAFLAIQAYDKVAVLVRGLKLVATDLGWLLTSAAVYGGADLTQFPVLPTQPAQDLHGLLTTLQLVKLARLFTAAPPVAAIQTLYDVIGGVQAGSLASPTQVQSAISSITGWPVADVESFTFALGLTYPGDYTRPLVFDALRKLAAMSTLVAVAGPVSAATTALAAALPDAVQPSVTVSTAFGFPAPPFYISIGAEVLLVTAFSGPGNTTWAVVRGQQGSTVAAAAVAATVTLAYGAQLVAWGGVPTDEMTASGMAASALGVIKGRQATESAWLTLAPTMMNPIRDRRSAALRAYLTGQKDGTGTLIYPDADHLFDYFLIDVRMTSCQVTSRIVQAYIAVQIFVERCLMNLETTLWNSIAPGVVVNPATDDAWDQWDWMSRYRIWEANREVFLWPENWLIESDRLNRTEIYQQFEQELRQSASTADFLETVVENYIDRLDGLAHLLVTGTCQDPETKVLYVVARSQADPPVFYLRSYDGQAWTGWSKTPLDIRAHQAVPVMYRGRLCLFWMDVKVSNEPKQTTTTAQTDSNPPPQAINKYVSLALNFSVLRDDVWTPAQLSKGKLFDKPIFDSTTQPSDTASVEALYTMKVQLQTGTGGYGAALFLDIFRLGLFNVTNEYNEPDDPLNYHVQEGDQTSAIHLGRAIFNGRFSDLELNNFIVPDVIPDSFPTVADYVFGSPLLAHAKQTYGPDAQPLLPLVTTDPNLTMDSWLVPMAGALQGFPSASGGSPQVIPIQFTASGLDWSPGALLQTASLPLRIVGPVTDPNFEPTSYFFFQDNQRCYVALSSKYYWTGSFFTPTSPSDPGSVPFELVYQFHPFYHPFTRLFWNQLAAGGFDLLYDPALQQAPDALDPAYADSFSFQETYQPTARVTWDHADDQTALATDIDTLQTSLVVSYNIWDGSTGFYVTIGSEQLKVVAAGGYNRTTWTVVRAQGGTAAAAALAGTLVVPTYASQDRPFLDFNYTSGAFAVYHWELFYHIPLYVAQMLSQNFQFEDARKWFHYIFNPTRKGTDPAPQRFWTPKPLRNLTTEEIWQERINELLTAVTTDNADAVNLVRQWRANPFNPFVLADMRPVSYMKSTVMSYLDNLIAWADNLFSTESREALSEATLIYVIADEILGPPPQAIPPPSRTDMSYTQLAPTLDAFANEMVEIENVLGSAYDGIVDFNPPGDAQLPPLTTFYFKIPPNAKLLGYWSTVADRLTKLRNCQSLSGAPLQLALFDAPIDPGLLIAARAAGVDLSSVLSDLGAPMPNYRFTTLYTQAADFVSALRAYGTELQTALEKKDTGAFLLLQQTLQQQMLEDSADLLDLAIQQANDQVENYTQAKAISQAKYDWNNSQPLMNDEEQTVETIGEAINSIYFLTAFIELCGATTSSLPDFFAGASGFGASPVATASVGGSMADRAATLVAAAAKTALTATDNISKMIASQATYKRRQDVWKEAAVEAQLAIAQAQAQLDGAGVSLQVAQRQKEIHDEQVDNLQKQIDFLTDKFTSDDLYDWMISSLAATYFQSYQLAYQLCKQVERCYQFELGIQNSSFIQFGYWDSLHKGLLAGDTLNHDLRRMQAAYFQQNIRRYEISRFVSLSALDPGTPGADGKPAVAGTLQNLLVNGFCYFTLPESLYDADYPGQYNRRLTRVSLTVVYPSPGKFDNIKSTLTMTSNQVRVKTDVGSGYPESPVGSDPRFIYNYAANAQKIALGNGQDDPGLFINTIANNIADQRYLPFENAGAISTWLLEMPQEYNEVDLSTVGDVIIHLYYTALEGGDDLKAAVQDYQTASAPTGGVKLFSAQNDFAAPLPTIANPYPLTPWQAFVAAPAAGQDQMLTLNISPLKFPTWTRGKTIHVTGLVLAAVSWPAVTSFVVVPAAPLPTVPVVMTPVAAATEPNFAAGIIAVPPTTMLGTWIFEIQVQGAADFRSLNKNIIGDILVFITFTVS